MEQISKIGINFEIRTNFKIGTNLKNVTNYKLKQILKLEQISKMENFRIGTNFKIGSNLFKFRKKKKRNSEERRKENKIKTTLPRPASDCLSIQNSRNENKTPLHHPPWAAIGATLTLAAAPPLSSSFLTATVGIGRRVKPARCRRRRSCLHPHAWQGGAGSPRSAALPSGRWHSGGGGVL
jgi:hypothetical protein